MHRINTNVFFPNFKPCKGEAPRRVNANPRRNLCYVFPSYARQACDSSQIVTRRKTGRPSSRTERFCSSLAQYPKKFMPLDFEFDAYLETPKLKRRSSSPLIHSET